MSVKVKRCQFLNTKLAHGRCSVTEKNMLILLPLFCTECKAALEREQRKAARFVTGNYDRTTSVTEMLQDLQWDTLETMRRHARLSTIYKMCHGLLDGDWGDYLITSKERRTRGSHDFKFIVPKGHKDIFRFSFFPRTITEWNKLPEEIVSSQSLCIFKSKLI